MRDTRYVAVHRGGPLSLERHRLLAAWAADCAERVLPLFAQARPADPRPAQAIAAARAWARGEISVGAARQASIAAHAAAREAAAPEADDAARYVARAAGHAVATAHMADHAPGAATFAIQALRASPNGDWEAEYAWHKAHLPEPIRELVVSTFESKFAHLGLAAAPRVIQQGQIYWAQVSKPDGLDAGIAHPHVVLQDDLLNRSRLSTVLVCALTTNRKRAQEPGNIMLELGEAGLEKASVIVVSQLATVEKNQLGAYIGHLSPERVEQIWAGLRFQQRAFFDR